MLTFVCFNETVGSGVYEGTGMGGGVEICGFSNEDECCGDADDESLFGEGSHPSRGFVSE